MSEQAGFRLKFNKKLKLATEKSMSFKENSKKRQFAHEERKSHKGDGDGIFIRKKRIYADQDYDKVDAAHSKTWHKKGLRRMRNDFSKEKNSNGPPRSIWVKSKSTSTVKSAGDNAQVTHSIVKTKTGETRLKDRPLKIYTKTKDQSSKYMDQRENKRMDSSPARSFKKNSSDKKLMDDNLEGHDDQRMKVKRVIRIDRHDISNKRLDDVILQDENNKEKENIVKENAEISKNAQFRAIQPSPSILSFVEENLLGRRRLIDLKRAGYNIELPAPLDNIPNSTSTERERIEENIFRNRLTFFAAAKVSSSFPPPEAPEIAFAGRSNVGKSSLLNSLTRQWGVVRTSDKPGLTQTINFFNLGPKLNLVDLPGYGFAYAKEEVKDTWEELVKEYVSTRVGLKRVCLLIDTKWGLKPRDRELIDLMERSQTKYQIVLTKTDTVFPVDVARRAMQIEESFKANRSVVQPVMMVSSKSGAGIRTLRTVLEKIARFAKV